jgi:transcriptional regulator with XRE-family HTH domain
VFKTRFRTITERRSVAKPRAGWTPRPGDVTAGEVFARRLAEVRKRRGLSAKALADKVSELGHPVHRSKIAKIESQDEKARAISLEDVLALAYALDVSPLYLITPIERFGPRMLIVGDGLPVDADDARVWLRGKAPLHGQDPKVFALERPSDEVPEALADLPAGVRDELMASWLPGDKKGEER